MVCRDSWFNTKAEAEDYLDRSQAEEEEGANEQYTYGYNDGYAAGYETGVSGGDFDPAPEGEPAPLAEVEEDAPREVG